MRSRTCSRFPRRCHARSRRIVFDGTREEILASRDPLCGNLLKDREPGDAAGVEYPGGGREATMKKTTVELS
jgi:hypothetical protein